MPCTDIALCDMWRSVTLHCGMQQPHIPQLRGNAPVENPQMTHILTGEMTTGEQYVLLKKRIKSFITTYGLSNCFSFSPQRGGKLY